MKAKIETLVTEYSGYKVGVDGVLEIKEQVPKTEGVQWFYDVIYKDGFIREFMPVRVRYKNYNDEEYPEPKFYENSITDVLITDKDNSFIYKNALTQKQFEQRLIDLLPKNVIFRRRRWTHNPGTTYYCNVENHDILGYYIDTKNWKIHCNGLGRE